jgi:hypothetical protein
MTLLRILIAALAGGVLSTAAAAATLGLRATWIPRFVSFAVADRIPSLHRRPEPLETVKQLFWIGLGIAIIATTHLLLEP